MGQLESFMLGNNEETSTKNVNAELQSEDGLIDTDNESRFKKIMKDFTLAQHNFKDPYLGNVDVYKCIHNKNFRIYLKEMFTKSEEELNEQVEMWIKRQSQLLHPNLIQLHYIYLKAMNKINPLNQHQITLNQQCLDSKNNLKKILK